MKKTIIATLPMLFFIFATGCALNRGILDINEMAYENPTEGKEVAFVRVSDKREFQIKPKQAHIPSLKNDEINDKEITSRAIARKRNTYGVAIGDILLPEGKTVMEVVENRLSKGFAENGYRVLSPKDSGYQTAIPIEVDIDKFWGWIDIGFWSIGINFETSIVVTAPVTDFEKGIEFDSEVQKRFQTASGRNWQTVIDLSMDELNDDIKSEIHRIQSFDTAKQQDEDDKSRSNVEERLQKLGDLRQKGLISDEEYKIQKARVLNSI